MFYDAFTALCAEKGVAPSTVCMEIGLSNSISTYWKQSKKPPKHDTLEKLSKYFGVPISRLLGEEEKEIAPVIDRSELFTILAGLTDQELDKVLDFAEFLISKRQNPVE